MPLSFKMVVEGENSGNHEGKNRTVEGNKNMKNGTIYTPGVVPHVKFREDPT